MRFRPIRFGAIRFSAIRFGAIPFSAIRFVAIRFHAIRFVALAISLLVISSFASGTRAAEKEESVFETCKRLEAARIDRVLTGVVGYNGEWIVKPEFAEIEPVAPKCFKVRRPGQSTTSLLRVTANGITEKPISEDVLREHIRWTPRTNYRITFGKDDEQKTFVNNQIAFFFKDKDKFGIRDASGKIILPAKFTELYVCDDDFFLAATGVRMTAGYREYLFDGTGRAIGKKGGYSSHDELNQLVENRFKGNAVEVPYQVIVSVDDGVHAIVNKRTESIVAPCHIALKKTPWYWYLGSPLGPLSQHFYPAMWKDEAIHLTNSIFEPETAISFVPRTRLQLFDGFLKDYNLIGMDRSEVVALLGEGRCSVRNGLQCLLYRATLNGHGGVGRDIEIALRDSKAISWRYVYAGK
jgi:hypothetical protein